MNKRRELRNVLSLITELTCKIMRVHGCSIELRSRKRDRFFSIADYGIRSPHFLSIPIMKDKDRIGEVRIYTKNQKIFIEEEIRFMTKITTQAVWCIEEIELTDEPNKNYFNTIYTLATAVETKEPFMKGHSRRVTDYALRVAQRLGLGELSLKNLYYSGQIHDIGKIRISDKILNKSGKLTETEYKIIKLHSEKGVQMLEPLKFFKKGLPIIRHHHERYDGTGYPDKLKGAQISLEARILACADSFDAMTSERPYKERLTFPRAIEELKASSKSQFDPKVVKAFIEILPQEIS